MYGCNVVIIRWRDERRDCFRGFFRSKLRSSLKSNLDKTKVLVLDKMMNG